eukprot:303970_1
MSYNLLKDSVVNAVNETIQENQQIASKKCNGEPNGCYYFDRIFNWHEFNQENLNHMLSINHWKDESEKPKCEYGKKCYSLNRILNKHIHNYNRMDDKCHMQVYYHPKDHKPVHVDTLNANNAKLIQFFNLCQIKTLTLDLFIQLLYFLPITDIFNIIYNNNYKLPSHNNKRFQILNIYLHSTNFYSNINKFHSYWNSIDLRYLLGYIRTKSMWTTEIKEGYEWMQDIGDMKKSNVDIDLCMMTLEEILGLYCDAEKFRGRG